MSGQELSHQDLFSTLIRSTGPDFILYVLLTVSISGSYNSNEEVERSSWIVQADVQAGLSAWLDCAPVLRVVEHQYQPLHIFLFLLPRQSRCEGGMCGQGNRSQGGKDRGRSRGRFPQLHQVALQSLRHKLTSCSCCCSHGDCQERDFNMVCNEQSQQCECREATQWSNKWDMRHQ